MGKTDFYILRGKIIIAVSFIIILISGGISIYLYNDEYNNDLSINYESVNVKDMATANISNKREIEKHSITSIINTYKKEETETPEAIELPVSNESKHLVDNRIWYLPCEVGEISGGINYHHYALDITSPRGVGEAIYPVADGVISNIYTDSAGALIITVNHNINGNLYTSQYVHFSKYEDGLYVGKEVTHDDILGYMGSTGIATGTHLHIALLDCNSFSNDNRCSDLGSFFNYGKTRYTQGFYGLSSVMNVPYNWTSR